MSTRQRRPSLRNKLAIAICLVAFQGYLGYHLVEGNFGIKSQDAFNLQVVELQAENASLDDRIAVAQNRNSLLASNRLDPDLLTEKARGLLGWAGPKDVIIPVIQD